MSQPNHTGTAANHTNIAAKTPTRLGVWMHRAGPFIVLAIFLAVAWLLFEELKQYKIHDIRHAFDSIPGWRIMAAIGLTAVNYLVLIGYDYTAIRAIKHPLPISKIALASFTGFVTSYNFGALLGGTSIRTRFYSAWGLSAVEIIRLVAMLVITFWVGMFAFAGLCFVVRPFPIPDSLHMPIDTVQPLGYIFLVIVAGYVILLSVHRKVRFRDREIELPGISTTLQQLFVAALDLLVASAALYVLVDEYITLSYGQFLGIYLLAIVATTISQVPGGIGVFELIVLKLAVPESGQPQAELLAALLAFRVIYYILPLLLAMSLIAVNEVRLHSGHARIRDRGTELASRVSRIAPTVLACGTFIAGAVLLFSGSVPVLQSRIDQLHHVLPLSLLEVSHFAGSLIGASLLILARGIQRRLDSAWWIAISLLTIGVITTLPRAFALNESILLLALIASLIGCRSEFYRKGQLIHERFTVGWLATVLMVFSCAVWLGFFAFKHINYSSELWWTFAFNDDAPRFMRSIIGATGLLLLFGVCKMVSPYKPKGAFSTPDELAIARPIVAKSTSVSSNLALLGDKSFLFNEQKDAFIMYSTWHRTWVAMGDPVGSADQCAELIWSYRELVDRYDGWPVFYEIGEKNLPAYLDQGMTLLKIGEEATVPLESFGLEGSRRRSLRQTYNRFQKKENCEFSIVSPSEVEEMIPRLKEISDAWLDEKHGHEKGFSLGFFDPDYIRRYPCAVIRRDDQPIAFANLLCGAGHEELSLDLMRYMPGSPSGVMEYLFIELMLWGKSQGYDHFSLGMAPLSGIENRRLAPLWNRAINLVVQHGSQFYNFDGLRKYKEKFGPTWRSKYIATPGGLSLPRVLADVTALIGQTRDEPDEDRDI